MEQQRRVVIEKQEQTKVREALKQRHRGHLRPGEGIEIEGWMTHGEAFVELVLRDPTEEAVLRLQARIDLVSQDIQDPSEGKELLFDLLDGALGEHLQDRLWSPPQDWKEHEAGVLSAWLRGRLRNLALERAAAELLSEPLEPDFDTE